MVRAAGFTNILVQEDEIYAAEGTNISFDNFSVTSPGSSFAGYSDGFESDAYGTEPTGWILSNTDANADVTVYNPNPRVPAGWNATASTPIPA